MVGRSKPALVVAVLVAQLGLVAPPAAAEPKEDEEKVIVLLDDAGDAEEVARRAGAHPPATEEDVIAEPNSMVVRATPTAQARLQVDPQVRGVMARGMTAAIAGSDTVRLIGAPRRWANGATGAGRTIAVIDSGVSEDFGGSVVGQACFVGSNVPGTGHCGANRTVDRAFDKACFAARVCDPAADPRDDKAARPCGTSSSTPRHCQHGSVVASVAARRTAPHGVARGAGVYAIQVFDPPGAQADMVDIYLALTHVIDMHDAGAFRFAAVNLSLVTEGAFGSICDKAASLGDTARFFHAAFRALRARGIAPVAATGNGGNVSRVAFPACLSNAIAVGATDTNHRVASSNRLRGHTFMAPGAGLTVRSAPGYATSWSGTSFAVPHVAGSMAVLNHEVPSANVDRRLSLMGRGCVWATDGSTRYPRVGLAQTGHVKYIDAVHRLFVQRNARRAEVDRWCRSVRGGQYMALTTRLATTDEWAGVEIRDLYRKILGRNPDSSGYQYWLGRVRNGAHIEGIAVLFYGSPEYFGRAGGTNWRFVGRLYRDLLGRAADPSGHNYWADRLNRGLLTRSGVAEGFYASTESRTSRVTRLYRVILGRNPDLSGKAYWVGRINELGDVSLAAHLAASPEYYRRVS